MMIGARNRMAGTAASVTDDVEATPAKGGHRPAATIAGQSAREPGRAPGETACAILEASGALAPAD